MRSSGDTMTGRWMGICREATGAGRHVCHPQGLLAGPWTSRCSQEFGSVFKEPAKRVRLVPAVWTCAGGDVCPSPRGGLLAARGRWWVGGTAPEACGSPALPLQRDPEGPRPFLSLTGLLGGSPELGSRTPSAEHNVPSV